MPDRRDKVPLHISTRLLTATFDPQRGARILSLTAKKTGREWLVPPPAAADRSEYGSSFTDRVIHGWDEMLPTIDACTVNGRQIPDHGEVWAVPWFLDEPQNSNGIRLTAHSRALPLVLSREASARGDAIVLDYELTNGGNASVPVQWTPHPQFALTSSTLVRFAPTPTTARISSPIRSADPTPWEQIENHSKEIPTGGHLKVWVEEPFALQSVMILDGDDTLTMGWRGAVLPYAAVLWDNGEFSQQRTLAIEPAMNPSDSLSRSLSLGQATHIRARQTLNWQIVLSASSPNIVHDLSDISYK